MDSLNKTGSVWYQQQVRSSAFHSDSITDARHHTTSRISSISSIARMQSHSSGCTVWIWIVASSRWSLWTRTTSNSTLTTSISTLGWSVLGMTSGTRRLNWVLLILCLITLSSLTRHLESSLSGWVMHSMPLPSSRLPWRSVWETGDEFGMN